MLILLRKNWNKLDLMSCASSLDAPLRPCRSIRPQDKPADVGPWSPEMAPPRRLPFHGVWTDQRERQLARHRPSTPMTYVEG